MALWIGREALWIGQDGVAEQYDPDLDMVIHFINEEGQEEFAQWLADEGVPQFVRWKRRETGR